MLYKVTLALLCAAAVTAPVAMAARMSLPSHQPLLEGLEADRKQMISFNPFTLQADADVHADDLAGDTRAISALRPLLTGLAADSPGVAEAEELDQLLLSPTSENTRPPIRVPYRPPVRSPYRPPL